MKLRKLPALLLLLSMLLCALPIAIWAEVTEPTIDNTESTATNKIEKVSVVLDESLALKYYTNIASTENASLECTMNLSVSADTSSGKYVFTASGIAPHQIAEEITAKLKLDGEVVDTKTYSIEQYCKDVDSAYAYTYASQLTSDILNYGIASYLYNNRDNPITVSECSFSDAAPSELASVITGNDGTDLYVHAAGVQFATQNKLYFKIYAGEGKDFTASIDGRSYNKSELVQKGGYYIVYSDAIKPTEYGTKKTLSVTDGSDINISVSYAVNTYIYNISNSTTNENMKALALALYNYGESCKKYVANGTAFYLCENYTNTEMNITWDGTAVGEGSTLAGNTVTTEGVESNYVIYNGIAYQLSNNTATTFSTSDGCLTWTGSSTKHIRVNADSCDKKPSEMVGTDKCLSITFTLDSNQTSTASNYYYQLRLKGTAELKIKISFANNPTANYDSEKNVITLAKGQKSELTTVINSNTGDINYYLNGNHIGTYAAGNEAIATYLSSYIMLFRQGDGVVKDTNTPRALYIYEIEVAAGAKYTVPTDSET